MMQYNASHQKKKKEEEEEEKLGSSSVRSTLEPFQKQHRGYFRVCVDLPEGVDTMITELGKNEVEGTRKADMRQTTEEEGVFHSSLLQSFNSFNFTACLQLTGFWRCHFEARTESRRC